MKVLVVGATGFTGSFVVPLLLEQGFHVRCFVRLSSDISRLMGTPETSRSRGREGAGGMWETTVRPVSFQDGVEIFYGDLSDKDSLLQALKGRDILVNLASLGFGHAPTIVEAATQARIARALFISTTAIYTKLSAPSKDVRVQAEETIRTSGLRYTILRPTMIFGSSRDRNICRLIRFLRRWPLVLIPGKSHRLLQPVYVGDLARAVVCAMGSAESLNRSYNVAGETALNLDQMIDIICGLLHRTVRKIHLPLRPIVTALEVLERCSVNLTIRAEQVLRLDEDKTFDYSAASRDFGYQPRPFVKGIALELAEMGLG